MNSLLGWYRINLWIPVHAICIQSQKLHLYIFATSWYLVHPGVLPAGGDLTVGVATPTGGFLQYYI